jgi:hypothetical protein
MYWSEGGMGNFGLRRQSRRLGCAGGKRRLCRRSPYGLLLLLLILAIPLFAEDFGPLTLTIESPMSSGSRVGAYVERAFVIVNRSAEPRDVRLSILMSSKAASYAVRTLKLPGRATQRVVMTWPVIDRGSMHLSVEVDGRGYPPQPLPDERWDDYEGRPVLISPALDDVAMQKKLPSGSDIVFRRASSSTPAWSTSWLAYDRFGGVVVTRQEWAEAPAPVQAAILRWVRCGGLLTIVPRANGGDDDAVVRLRTTYLGFGRILDSNNDITRFPPTMMENLQRDWARVPVGGKEEAVRSSVGSLLGDARVPTGLLLWFLIAFAVVAGPVSLAMLAKKNRRIWIFWSVPAAGVAASLFIVLVTLASEGVHSVSRVRGLTYLDEVAGEATTLAWAGFYCTFPPDGTLRFDGDTEVRPASFTGGVTVDLGDGQHFAGLIGSRVASFIALRRSEPRRERMVFRMEHGSLTAVNGLGAPVSALRVMMPDGGVWAGSNLAAGAKQVLTPRGRPASAAPESVAKILSERSYWEALPEVKSEGQESPLRPGMYMATLASNPFVEFPLGRGREATSSGVVIGMMRGEGGDAR